jgi:hypothetical protein
VYPQKKEERALKRYLILAVVLLVGVVDEVGDGRAGRRLRLVDHLADHLAVGGRVDAAAAERDVGGGVLGAGLGHADDEVGRADGEGVAHRHVARDGRLHRLHDARVLLGGVGGGALLLLQVDFVQERLAFQVLAVGALREERNKGFKYCITVIKSYYWSKSTTFI